MISSDAMVSFRVLLICNDAWISKLISTVFGQTGADVTISQTAQSGVMATCANEPDLIICDGALPDKSASWVVGRVREEPTVSTTPFLLLSYEGDFHSRIDAFQHGADAFISRPFRVEEILAQSHALVAMAHRLRRRPKVSVVPMAMNSEPPESVLMSALEGDIAHLSLGTVFTMLEMERRSGVLTVAGARQTATIVLNSGSAVSGNLGGESIPPLQVLKRILRWKRGRFIFRPGEVTEVADDRSSIGKLLIEAACLVDEGGDIPSSEMFDDIAMESEPPTLVRNARKSKRPSLKPPPDASKRETTRPLIPRPSPVPKPMTGTSVTLPRPTGFRGTIPKPSGRPPSKR
jgi:two-component system, OmpR family, response regulator